MAKNRVRTLKKIWLSRLLILIQLVFWWLLLLDVKWALNSQISVFRFLHYATKHYVPIFILPLFYAEGNHGWHKIFHWKVWIFPCVFILTYSLWQWRFIHTLNYDLSILGYEWMKWQWAALIEWTLLFMLLLFLWQQKIGKPRAFSLSFYSVLLASIIYEMPWYIYSGKWIIEFAYARLPISLMMVVLLLYLSHWKMPRFYPLTFIFMFTCWLFYPYPPNTYWIPRLTTYPIFATLPFGSKNKLSTLRINKKSDCS